MFSFEWTDGPESRGEFHRLYKFSPEDGESIFGKSEVLRRHGVHRGSYKDWRLSVPEGSLIVQIDQYRGGPWAIRGWIADEQRPAFFSHDGGWEDFRSVPNTPDGLSDAIWHRILEQIVADPILEIWK